MTNLTTGTDSFAPATETAAHLFDNWFDTIESGVRERVRGFIEELIRCELDAALARPRYGRAKNADSGPANLVGHRHGSRTRSLTGSFGKTELTVPRARLQTRDGNTTEWHSQVLRSYQRRTLTADALIAGAYLAGTNTRRVRRALAALFRDGVSKDIVSRVWRKIKSDWDAWNARSLTDEPMVRLILDGTVVRVRLEPRRSRRSVVHVCTFAADPMAQRADDECDRTAARGVQAPDQNADRAAISGDCRHVVLGSACLRPDQHAQGRRLADACHDDYRSAN
jgi:putative transposase